MTALAFSHDGKRLAAGAGDTIDVWDIGTGQWTTSLQADSKPFTDVEFSPDHRRVAATSLDGNVYIWGVSHGLIEKSVGLAVYKKYSIDFLGKRPEKVAFIRGTVSGIPFSEDGARIIIHQASGDLDRATFLDARCFSQTRFLYGKPLYADFDRFVGCNSSRIIGRSSLDGSVVFQTDLKGLLVREVDNGFADQLGVREFVPASPKEIIAIGDHMVYVNIDIHHRYKSKQIKGFGVWDIRAGGGSGGVI